MPETYIQVPPNSTGAKMRGRSRVVGADTVVDQFIAQSGEPEWTIFTPAAAFAANKHFLTMFNAAASAQVIKLRKLFLVNMQTVAITGVAVQFDTKRITAVTGGTAVTPVIHDSTDPVLTNFTCVAAPTSVTEGALFFSTPTNNDEELLSGAASRGLQLQQTNLIPEDIEGKEYEMNPGEGITVKNITSTTVGSFSILAVIARAL